MGWTKGSSFVESRQKRGTAEYPRSPRGLGRAEESKLDSTPAISNHPNSAEPGSSIIIFLSRLSALDARLLPAEPYSPRATDKIREESFPADISNDTTESSLPVQDSEVSETEPVDKAFIAAIANLQKSTPDPLAVQNYALACHWNLTLCSMHQSFAGVTEAAAACL
jgi:hypothetical protein